MANIRRRTGRDGKVSFAVQVRKVGYPSRTATFPTRRLAERWATTVEAEMIEGRHFRHASARDRTVHDAIDRFKTDPKRLASPKYKDKKNFTQRLDWWDAKLGPVHLRDLTAELIEEHLEALKDEPFVRSKAANARQFTRSPRTVNRYRAALSKVLSVCVRPWRWLPVNPFAQVEREHEGGRTGRVLTDAERIRLLAEVQKDAQLNAIVHAAIATLPRAGELTRLEWPDIDLAALADPKVDAVRVLLRDTKNGEPRTAWLYGKALRLMREHWVARGGPITAGRVFVGEGRLYAKAGRRRDGGLYYYRGPFERACERAGVERFRFHDLRHCGATWLAEEGATDAQLKAVGGWRSNVVSIYTHLAANDVAGVVRRMNDKKVT